MTFRNVNILHSVVSMYWKNKLVQSHKYKSKQHLHIEVSQIPNQFREGRTANKIIEQR